MSRAAHPTLPGVLVGSDERIGDRAERWPETASDTPYASPFVTVRTVTVTTPEGGSIDRTVVEHDDAVAVVALDDEGRVLLLEQYRHPVGQRLLELPAGLLDIEGEDPRDAAARELGEETDLVASRWETLVTLRSSPGFTDERVTVYLAGGLAAVPDDARTERRDEEADMTTVWVPLDEAVAAVLDGRITNALAVAGLLATHARTR